MIRRDIVATCVLEDDLAVPGSMGGKRQRRWKADEVRTDDGHLALSS